MSKYRNKFISITIPNDVYEYGFCTNVDPYALNNKDLILGPIKLLYKQSYEFLDHNPKKIFNKNGPNVSKNIKYNYKKNVFIVDPPKKTGYTLYDLGKIVYEVQKYVDINDHDDENILVYQIDIDIINGDYVMSCHCNS